MSGSNGPEAVRALAKNLASLWTGGRDVLDVIVRAAESSATVSPWAALQDLGDHGLERLLSDPEFSAKVSEAFRELSRYLASETWFDRAAATDDRLAALGDRPVAYVCMEYGLASWLPIYSGGLGILAGDVLKEASDMGLPLVAVGLLYRHGFFSQQLDESDYQTEIVPTIDPYREPFDSVTDDSGNELRVPIPIADKTVYARLWKLQIGRVPLYLLDTDVPENELQDDREITASLYGGDEQTRIRQEIVLGVGGIRALRALGIQPSIFSMNEGHAAFLGLEILTDELRGANFSTAQERTRQRVVYTNHTVVPAGNDVFHRDVVRQYLGRYAEERGLALDRLLDLGGSGDYFSMTLLAFALAGKANAVSESHAHVIPSEWPGYSVEAVTNGVHVPTWIGPRIRHLLDEYVPDWQADQPNWERIHDIPDECLQQVRSEQRKCLVDFINRSQSRVTFDPDVLTVVWARRFAEYKRAWLIASDLARLSRLLGDPGKPVQLVISGKAHPRDDGGKQMMHDLLHRLREDPVVAAHSVFVADYNEQVARCLVAGADVWLNTPRRPLEASGTSGMKSSDNGGIQVTVRDGWAAEVEWWGVGWGVEGRDDRFDAQELYSFLEDGVIPTFYNRDAHGDSHGWSEMMKNTMLVSLSRYSTRRMMLNYIRKLYVPLLEEQLPLISPA